MSFREQGLHGLKPVLDRLTPFLFWLPSLFGVGRLLGGGHLLVLHTVGRKTGRPYATPLTYARDGQDYLIVSDNHGQPTAPGWYNNLKVNPKAEINVNRKRIGVTARVVQPTDPAYERLWQIVNQNNDNRYIEYQKKTSRPIQVVVLTPRATEQAGAPTIATTEYDNGLETFALHSEDPVMGSTVDGINEQVGRAAEASPVKQENLDPETAARRYLDQLIASPQLRSITDEDKQAEYHAIGTEAVPLLGSKVVKFVQYRQHVPVYGSLVTIELDDRNNLLAVNSALGNPDNVDPVATISPAMAKSVIAKDAGNEALLLHDAPQQYFYYDNTTEPGAWRLVYIYDDVQRRVDSESANGPAASPEFFDYVVDAHSGGLVARLPRTKSISWALEELDSTDGLGHRRRIRAQRNTNGNRRLLDPARRIETYDFEFRTIEVEHGSLPGSGPVTDSPEPWDPGAVSAHANTQDVADYFLNTLQRNGLDNAGGPYISSINCASQWEPDPKQWRNAVWIPVHSQVVYGQRSVNGTLRSYAVAKEIVAHEITHGLTDKTARLEYRYEPGALNESYSDIFGVLVANAERPNIEDWNWEMGAELNGTGLPIRDLSDPARCGHPAHMRDFVYTSEDHGGVHTNSGIHNKAAFNLISATDGKVYIFEPREAAAVFYLALTLHLSRTSGFRDSRRAVVLAAKSLFRHDPQNVRDMKLAAIGEAFDAVGISA